MSIYYSPPPATKKELQIRASLIAAIFISTLVLGLIFGSSLLSQLPLAFFLAVVFSLFAFGILSSARNQAHLKLHLDIGERKIFVEKTQDQELKRMSYDMEDFLELGFRKSRPSARFKNRLPAEIFLKLADTIHDTERPSKNNFISQAINELDGTRVSYWRVPLWTMEHPTTLENAHEITSKANKWLEKYLLRKDRGFLERDAGFDVENLKGSRPSVKRDFSDLE